MNAPRIKKGGHNPVSNTALAALLEKAKEMDIPKDIIDRNIKRASEKGQEAYIEKFYEVSCYTTCDIWLHLKILRNLILTNNLKYVFSDLWLWRSWNDCSGVNR